MKKCYPKILSLLLCLVLLLSMAIPATLATSMDSDQSTGTFTAEDTPSEDTPPESTPTEGTEENTTPTEGSDEATVPSEDEELPSGEAADASDTDPTEPAEGEASGEEPNGEADCTCGTETGEHTEDCPCYAAPECTCGREDDDHDENCPLYTSLYDKFMACETFAQMEALLVGMTDAQLEEFLSSLSSDELDALRGKASGLIAADATPPKTVPYFSAGPFMPAVDVSPVRFRARARSAEPEGVDTEGVVTSKSVTDNGNGTYTLRMESYVTGATTTTVVTNTTPVDIVLVLDQSGSMKYDFNGNTTTTNSARRQYAMKQAVNNFINAVSDKFDAESSDHRMAIVTFGSSASNLRGWTTVDSSGATSLHSAINALPDEPSGSTNVGAGMSNAVSLMGSGYNYTGSNMVRQKVVIVFTDGVPTTASRFDVGVANTALVHANTLKNSGATIYSIGIFSGANISQLFGTENNGFDQGSDGSVGSHWSNYEGVFVGDVSTTDVPAGNRFLNYLSNNYTGVTNVGLKEYENKFLLWGQAGWEITANASRQTSGYYLTAENSGGLNSIFSSISSNIQTGGATISLTTETVLKDIISPYFQLPEGATAADITVKTASCNSFNGDTPVWSNEQTVNLTPTIDGNMVSVSGFNYSDNWVGKDTNTGAVHPGKKLILEFTIVPKDGFLGGNDVPTNESGSGIYVGDSPVENFDIPITDVAIQAPEVYFETNTTVNGQDMHVYLMDSLTPADLMTGAVFMVGDVQVINDPANNYGLEDWQASYVDLTFGVFPATGFTNITQDQSYRLGLSVNPKIQSNDGQGDQYNDATGYIYVYKPVVTFRDGEVFYGDNIPTDYNSYKTTLQWKHGDELSSDNPMLGEPPTVSFTYTPGAGISNGKIASLEDIPVKAAAKINGVDVTAHTTFLHTSCSSGCGWTAPAAPGDPAFLLHVKDTSLTIINAGADLIHDPNQSFLFTVSGPNGLTFQVVITGNGSKTIRNLPLGDYTVTADTPWSWRYTPAEGTKTVTLTGEQAGSLTFQNQRSVIAWLDGNASVLRNLFAGNQN